MTRFRYRTKARHGSGKHDLAECSAQVVKIIEHGAKFCRDVKGNEISMKGEETNRQAAVVGKRLLIIASALLGEHRPAYYPHTQEGNTSDRLAVIQPIPAMISDTTLLHSTQKIGDNVPVRGAETRPENRKATQLQLELHDLKIENTALKEELEAHQAKIWMLIFDLHFAGKALKKTIAELRTLKMVQTEPEEEVPLMLQDRLSVEGDTEEVGEEMAEHGSGEEENEGLQEPADQPRADIEVESVHLIGMEIAQRVERREKDILGVKATTLGDQLDKEKEDRVVEREALMGEKKTTQITMEKQTTDHRQEIKVLMGQLQEAWNRGLYLTQQLNDANDHNRDLQLQLKEAQDALAESKRQFAFLRSENLLLQSEVYKLRLRSRPFKPGSGAVKYRLKKQEIARMGTIARKDWSEVQKQVQEKGREAEDSSMVDANGGGPSYPVVGLQTTTKEDIRFKTEDPVVRLPALGVTKVLSPANTQSTHNALIPIPETTTIQPLDIEPQPIRVQLPDLQANGDSKYRRKAQKEEDNANAAQPVDSPRLSVGLHAEQRQHGKALVTGLELASRHRTTKNRLQCDLPHSSRTPLACITNQVVDRRCTVIP